MAELDALFKYLLSVIVVIAILTIFFFGFGPMKVSVGDLSLYAPVPTISSFASLFFEKIKGDLVPSGVEVIVTSPASGFLAQFVIAFFFALIFALPYIVYKTVLYLKPALHHHERAVAMKVVAPSFLLFAGGCLFSYFLLVPPAFSVLYAYAGALGATSFLEVQTFISFVVGLTLISGILFLLPIFMYLLTKLSIVEPSFWKEKWRYAIVFFLILSAVVTPDGSGTTMVILMVPMLLLYAFGIFLSSGVKLRKSI